MMAGTVAFSIVAKSCNLYDIAVFSVDTYETGYSVVSS